MSESESRLTRASESSESHTTQSESKADTACDSLLDTVKSTFDPFKETFSSDGSVLHHLSAGVNSLASLQGMPSQLLNTGIAEIPLLDKVPGMPAATIGVPHLGTPHAHSHPPSSGFPLPSSGMTIGAGCLSVLIGGIPAARVLDIGFAPTCGGLTPYFDIQTGSSNTFIGGMRAARMGIDMTRHCNPMGHAGKSGGEAASAAEKSEEVASEAAQVTGRAKALGLTGKAWSVGNAAVGPASGAATAASDIKHHEALAAAMTAAQTAADLAFMMLSNLMGKDPGIEPSMGTLLAGDPTVLIGGFPLPDSQMMWHGAKHGIGKKVRPKLSKWAQKLACEMFGEPVCAVTGEVENDFTDYETDEVVPFKWGRHYCSGWNKRTGALGFGFRHTWQHELQLLRTQAIYTNPSGTDYAFSRSADGTYRGICQGYVLEQQNNRRFIVQHALVGEIIFERYDDASRTTHCVNVNLNGICNIFDWHTDGYIKRITQSDQSGYVRRLVTLKIDDVGRIVEVLLTNSDGRNNQIAQYTYDAVGCLRSFRNAINALFAYEYDSRRHMVKSSNANDYAFFYRYDHNGRCVESTGQDGMWHVRFQYELGRTIVTEGDDGRWIVIYNDVGTITRVVDPYGGTTEYVLGKDGRIQNEIDSGGQAIFWLYDSLTRNTGRLDRWANVWPIKDDSPNLPNPLSLKVSSTALGLQWGDNPETSRHLSSLAPEITSLAETILVNNVSMAMPVKQRDEAGRIIAHTDVYGRTEQQSYDDSGNLSRRNDQDGRDYHYSFVSWSLRESKTDPLGNTVRFQYTSKRKISTVVDANGNESNYIYDLKDRIIGIRRHGVLREKYTYDHGDRLIEKRDGAGNLLLHFEVGNNGLYSKRVLSSGEVHSFAYDRHGRFAKASTKKFDVEITHSALGQRTTDKRDGKGVDHVYDGRHQSAMTYLGRFTVRYEVAEDSVRIHTPTGGTHILQRTPNGQILLRLGNGTNTLYGFDGLGRRTGRLVWPDGDTKRVHLVQYQYSATGELRRVIDSAIGTTEYHYDATHRLIGETRDGWPVRRFEYDNGGNLLSTPVCTWMRYTEGNRLASSSTSAFLYNQRNHLAEEIDKNNRRTTYHYDSMDLLVKVGWSDRDETWTAEYDGLCRRVAKTMGDERTDYYWDGNRLAAEIGANGRLRIFAYVNNEALLPFMFIEYPSIDASPAAGHAYYVISNQVGLPEWIESHDGELAWWANDIDPYGAIDVALGSSINYDMRWPGHWLERETGLHYNRFRSYSPVLGRYLQSDPKGQAGGVNLYAYIANPLVAVDVLGLHDSREDISDISDPDASGSHREAAILHELQNFEHDHPDPDVPLSEEDYERRAALYDALDSLQNNGSPIDFGRITPEDFNVKSIADDPRLLRMWEDSTRELYNGNGRTGKALREYLSTIEMGKTPTTDQARAAFNSIRAKFVDKVNFEHGTGQSFDGYSFDEIHHWNWPMSDNSFHALDPRHLFPVDESTHDLIHSRVTSGPHPTYNPIDPRHKIDLDDSHPLAPTK